nr:sensory neuron membrane protein 1-like [Danaus plexippus plexippus]
MEINKAGDDRNGAVIIFNQILLFDPNTNLAVHECCQYIDNNFATFMLNNFEITGTPMVAKQRVQLSMQLLKTDKIELCKNLPDVISPLFWIEEGIALNKTFVNMLKHQLFLPKRIVGVVRWLLVSSGLLGLLACLVFHFKGTLNMVGFLGYVEDKK